MNRKNSELHVLDKAKEIIEKGGFSRAQKLISDYISSHRTEKCVTLKALSALCLYHIGDHDQALSCAEGLLVDQADDLREPLPVEVVAYICLSLGCQRSESMNFIARMYRNGWECTSSDHLGEKYAATQVLLGNFTEFQRTARQLTKISKSPKHQLWAIVGNCLNEENEALQSLGMSMLRRFLYEASPGETKNTRQEWEKMFSFYTLNYLRRCTTDNYREKFDQLVVESLSDTGTHSNAHMHTHMGWIIGTLVDSYIRTSSVEQTSDWKTPTILCAALLQSGMLSEERHSCCSIDSRNNFKYFSFLLGATHFVCMNDSDTKIISIIDSYLIQKDSPPLLFTRKVSFNLVDMLREIPCVEQRNKSLLNIHIALRQFTDEKSLVDLLLAYCQAYGSLNERACFYDIQPVVIALVEKLCVNKSRADECAPLNQILCGLETLPALQLHIILIISTQFSHNFEFCSLATRIELAISSIVKNTSRSCYADFVIAQALVSQGEQLSALAFLHCSLKQSELNYSIATYVAGRLGVFDAHERIERLSLRNIQLDTMSYLYFDSLIEGYFPEHLKTVCHDSVEFYRSAGGSDALHLVEGALNHLDWNIVRDEIPVLRERLTYSLHRAECLVWHVLSQMEQMSSDDALQFLHKRGNMIQEAQSIIAAGSSRICTNEDRTVLGECISERLSGRSVDVRIADLERITSFIQIMLYSPGEEWDRTDCFGLNKLASFSGYEPFGASDLSIDEVKNFGFPGLCLLLCSITQEFGKKTNYIQRKLGLIRKAVEYSTKFFSNSADMPLQSVNTRLAQECLVCVVPGFNEVINHYENVRASTLSRWRKSLDRRLQEIQSLDASSR